MDSRTRRQLGLLAILPILVTGCAAAHAAPEAAPGMSMPGMAPTTSAPVPTGSGTAAGPSASARMVCGPEIRRDVATALGLRTPPTATTSWVDHLYTCTYRLRTGSLVLSVKESPDVPAARGYFSAVQHRLGNTHPLLGLSALGLPAYDTTDGTVVFLKDDKVLQVDATTLPHEAGQPDSRSGLAYEVATDVLGCWTGK